MKKEDGLIPGWFEADVMLPFINSIRSGALANDEAADRTTDDCAKNFSRGVAAGFREAEKQLTDILERHGYLFHI